MPTSPPRPSLSRPAASAPRWGQRSEAGPRLARLRDITSAINAGGDLQTSLDRVLFAVCRGEPWSRGGIMAANRASGYSELVASFAPDEQGHDARPRRWYLATSPVLRVVETRRPLVIEDAQLAAEFPHYQEDALARGYRTAVLMPLGCTTAEEHEMVLSIHTRDRVTVTDEEIDFLTTIAHLLAIAVEKVKHLQHERRQSERLRRVLDIGSTLMELVLEGASLAVTAGVVGAILPDPFVILDFINGTTIAHHSPAPDVLTERAWSDLAQGAAAPLLAGLAERMDGTGRLDLSPLGLPLELPVLAEALRVDGETVGALLIFPHNRTFDSLDRVVTQEVRFALGAQIMRYHAEAKREAQDLADFFEQLCRHGTGDPARHRARATRRGIDLARPMHLLAVAPPAGKGPVTMTELRRLLAATLPKALPGSFVIEQGEAVAIGIPEAETRQLPLAMLERHLVQAVRTRWGGQPLVAYGPVCAAPADYGAAWSACERVLHLARMFRRDGLVRQEDFGSFPLLLSALDGATVRDFVEGTLGPLRRHDAENAGGLLETAITFIDQACRYQGTAGRLGIHVSTLRYRLKRLEELFGLDLEDAETRFRLSLASRLTAIATSNGSSAES